jgi:hypothetical protein
MGAIYIWQNWETLGPKFKALWDRLACAANYSCDQTKRRSKFKLENASTYPHYRHR